MEKIFKFLLEIADSQVIKVPQSSKLLCLQTQNDVPCIWAMVKPEAPLVNVTIEMYGTGHPIPDGDRTYLSTFQVKDGLYVFHCFILNK